MRASGGHRPLPGGGHPPGPGQRQAVAGSGREEVRLLRRLLSALPAHADQRSGQFQDRHLGRRQALLDPHQADVPQAGRRRPAEQRAALAGSVRGGRQDPRRLQAGRPRVGAHGRVDRAHRLAALLRDDRPAVHQVPRRQLAWRACQPEPVGAPALLGSTCRDAAAPRQAAADRNKEKNDEVRHPGQ
ncbi:hypothetical protein MTBUT4_370046 [Magnetospirillum sp. UT-4]|nr:hypothetical protein MTBUT4_370046 [Magnetospirillum sp. UT-4]